MSDKQNNNKKQNKKAAKKEEEVEATEPVSVPNKAGPKTPFNTPVVTSMPQRGGKGGAKNKPPVEEDDDEDDGGQITLEQFKNQFGHLMMQNPDEFIATLPAEVQTRVKVLSHIQDKYNELRKAFYKEVKELEKKYDELYVPLYKRRSEIVTGTSEPTEDELSVATKVVEIDNPHAASAIKGVPEFWSKALKNEDTVAEAVTERDDEALKHLIDLSYETFETEETKAFKLIFKFSENPFFSNEILTKTYFYVEDDELLLDKAEGTEINWKSPEQNLTVITVKKKQRQKGSKNVRTVTKTEPCDSFFNFFNPPSLDQELDQDDDDEEEPVTIEDLVEADFEMGQIIKERVIPKAVDYFTGKAVWDADMEGAFLGDQDEDDEDEEDEDEEEEEVPKSKKGAAKGGKPAAGQPAGDNPECKQQ